MARAKVARIHSQVAPVRRARKLLVPVKGRGSSGIVNAARTDLPGLRERKKARLRQQIIDTSIRLFRKRGYENTRVEDIVQILEISQPTFFRYFPSKDAVLREVGRRGFSCIKEHLETELSREATTAERLRRMYEGMARGGIGPAAVASRCAVGGDGPGAFPGDSAA